MRVKQERTQIRSPQHLPRIIVRDPQREDPAHFACRQEALDQQLGNADADFSLIGQGAYPTR